MTFRPAGPDDGAALAELIFIAGQSQYDNSGYDLSLGGPRDRQIAELEKLARTEARSWFHYSHFALADADRSVVAAAAGFEKIAADRNIPAALREIGWGNERIAALQERLESTFGCIPPEPAGFWTLDHVAVLPAWRNRGLARGCVKQVLDTGKDLGYTQCKLEVFRGNAPARALYDSLGFTLSETFDCDAMRRVLSRDALERLTVML